MHVFAQLKERIAELEAASEQQVLDYETRLAAQKAEYEQLLGRREREHEEGGNLLTMLQADVNRLNAERSVCARAQRCSIKP